MKIEFKNKAVFKALLSEVYAFRLEHAVGFISEGDDDFVLWFEGDNYPQVVTVVKNYEEDTTLANSLINSGVIDSQDEIVEVYSEDEFELIFKEM